MLKLKLQYFSHLMWRVNSLEKTLSWEKLRAGGGGGNRYWDGWMASLTQWTWVWANSGRLWRTGKPGVLQSMGLQSRTRLSDWTELTIYLAIQLLGICPKELKAGSPGDIWTPIFKTALFTQISPNRWMTKNCGTYVHRWACMLKKKKILSHATTWRNFKDIMLSAISQSQKKKHSVTVLVFNTLSNHNHSNRKILPMNRQ